MMDLVVPDDIPRRVADQESAAGGKIVSSVAEFAIDDGCVHPRQGTSFRFLPLPGEPFMENFDSPRAEIMNPAARDKRSAASFPDLKTV